MDHIPVSNPASTIQGRNWLEVVRQQVESLRFGAVEIVVHDSRVTQIETTERLRFERGPSVQLAETDKSEPVNWGVNPKPGQPL